MSTPQVSFTRPEAKKVEYKRFNAVAPKRMIMSVDGPPKSGKTEFCLTLPGPICFHSFNLGLEGVVEKHLGEKEIYEFTYTVPQSARLPGSPFVGLSDPAAKVWEEFTRNFRASLQDMRSVVVDLTGEAWALCRLARLGKLVQIPPLKYVEVNSEFRQLTQLALSQNETNVAYVHSVRPVYKNEQKTEETERSGFGEIEYDVQTVLRTNRDHKLSGAEQFSVSVEECRARALASGTEFRGSNCSFAKIATAIYPDTTEEFWSK